MSGGRAALLGALFVLAGCAAQPTASDYVEATSSDSRAAERAREQGQLEAAVIALDAIVARPVPDELSEDHARVIRQDAHDRLARIRLRRGDLVAAERDVTAGLALGEHEDLFTANLLTTRGRIHEAAGRDLEAARDYHRALEIHETLLDRALGEDR